MQIASFWIPDFLFAAQSNACLYDCWCHFPRGVLVVEVEILLAVDKCPTIRALKSFIAGFRNWSKNAQSIESRKVTDCCCAESGQEVEICPTPEHGWIFLQILPKISIFPHMTGSLYETLFNAWKCPQFKPVITGVSSCMMTENGGRFIIHQLVVFNHKMAFSANFCALKRKIYACHLWRHHIFSVL